MTLGEKIALTRKQSNLSQDDLAKKTGISRDTIGKYERNEIIPTVEKAKKISETLDVSLDFLTDREIKKEILDKGSFERASEIQKLNLLPLR